MTRSQDEPPRGDAPELEAELLPVVDALQRLPAVRPGAIERVAAAARGEPLSAPAPLRRRWRSVAAATAAALLVSAVGVRIAKDGQSSGGGDIMATPSASPAVVPDTPTSDSSPTQRMTVASLGEGGVLDDAPVPVPFVLRFPGASRVALVGDFNGWNPAATPLSATANGVWTATVSLTPGRHAYGFVVDDTLWVRDPRAELERDADYGRDHSVIVVGRP